MGKNSLFFGVILVLVAFVYSGCEETSNIGFPVGEEKLQTILLDTFTVKTSTILLDSISTSGSGRILVGEYHDASFGKTISSSFLQLGSQNTYSWSPPASAVFDSMVLILKYDKYFYGDTTQVQNLMVHELSEAIAPRLITNSENRSYFFSGVLFNSSQTNIYPTPLGSVSYKPRPMSKGTVSVRLNTPKGKEWFDIAKGENKTQLYAENFLNLFQGVRISTASPANAAAVGFVSDSTIMRIYYRQPNLEGILTQTHFDFKTYNSYLQYNKIHTDRSGTPLQYLVAGSPVDSELTNNETFVQGSAGVLTKVEFPNFKYLTVNNDKFLVLAARLVVVPISTEQGEKALPPNLGLLLMNKANIPVAPGALDFDHTKALTSTLWHMEGSRLVQNADTEFNRTSQYWFSLIEYTDALINRNPNTLPSLMLYTPSTFSNSVTQLRIGNGINQNSRIKLEIYLSRLK